MHTFLYRRQLLAAWLLGSTILAGADTALAQPSSIDTPPSPALSELIRSALEENPGVRAAKSAVDAAAAMQRAASRPLYNPDLAVDAERGETSTASLGLDQTIDWADKRGARTDLAAHELAARRQELEALRQAVAGELLSALGDFQTAQALQELAQRRAALMQRFRDLAEKRREAGDLDQVELDLARLSAIRAEFQQKQAAADRAQAAQALVAVIGRSRPDLPGLPEDPPAIDKFDTEAILSDLPMLRAQQARIAAARSAVALRGRERRPDPTIGVRGGRDGGDNLVGLSVSVPLFVRNTYKAEVDAANAELIQAEREGQDLYRRTRARLLAAVERYRLSRAAWATWLNSGQASLTRQAELLERIWQAGEMSTADYLVQLNQTLETRSDALEVRGRLWSAWADWLVASGRIEAWLGVKTPTPPTAR